jgi:hypothetical protein
VKRPFWDEGDEVCRTSWLERHDIDEQIGTGDWGYRVFRCRVCGTYWMATGRGIITVSEDHALRVIRREPEPPEEPLADFLVRPARRDWPSEDGRVILPDAPMTESEGYNAVLRWQTEVLSAIADVLDADPGAEHYVFELQHETYGGGRIHRDGYNLLVPGPLDWERARALLDPNLPDDWQRDGGTGAVVAIGSLSRSIPVRGPSEVVSVGTGTSGRRRLKRRQQDYERWLASQSPIHQPLP